MSPAATWISRGQIAEAQLGPAEVGEHRDVRPVGARAPHARRLIARRRVRQVHAQHVDARVEQPLERARRILRRSDGGDDLRPALGTGPLYPRALARGSVAGAAVDFNAALGSSTYGRKRGPG